MTIFIKFSLAVLVSSTPILAGSGGIVNAVNNMLQLDANHAFSVTSLDMDTLECKNLHDFISLPSTIDPDTGARVKVFKDKVTGEYKIVTESSE